MRVGTRLVGLLLPITLVSGGCVNTMMFSTATKVGIDISQRADQIIDVSLGYDRIEVVSIPAPKDADAGPDTEAYSVLGIFDLRYGNPWLDRPLVVNQFFGTGNAAQKMAKDARFQRFFGEKAGQLAPEPTRTGTK
jgi:hypothetical protein